MTLDPHKLADLHAACFTFPRPWTAQEFSTQLSDSKSVFCGDDLGFVIGRVVLDEVELLTIAVSPDLQGQGRGTKLLNEFLQIAAQRGATSCFLEVAETNKTARALYANAGFQQIGLRKKYYSVSSGPMVDAIVLSRAVQTG